MLNTGWSNGEVVTKFNKKLLKWKTRKDDLPYKNNLEIGAAWECVGLKSRGTQYKNRKGEVGRIFTHFASPIHFYSFIQEVPIQTRCFHETIQGDDLQKFYIDIDMSENIETGFQVVDSCKLSLKLAFQELYNVELQENNILVYTSNDNTKFSSHIVVNGYCVTSNLESSYIFSIVKRIANKDIVDYLDHGVYKSFRSLRTIYSHKAGSNRTKTKLGSNGPNYEDFLDSLITHVSDCKVLPEVAPHIEKVRPETQIDDVLAGKIVNVVFNKYGSIFSFRDVDEKIPGRVNFIRNRTSYCELCRKEHQNENPFAEINSFGDLQFNCRRSNGRSLILINGLVKPEDNPNDDMRDVIKSFEEASDVSHESNEHFATEEVQTSIPGVTVVRENYRKTKRRDNKEKTPSPTPSPSTESTESSLSPSEVEDDFDLGVDFSLLSCQSEHREQCEYREPEPTPNYSDNSDDLGVDFSLLSQPNEHSEPSWGVDFSILTNEVPVTPERKRIYDPFEFMNPLINNRRPGQRNKRRTKMVRSSDKVHQPRTRLYNP